jgi:hypothetical protein
LIAQFAGRSRGVGEKSFRVAVHEGNGQHYWLLRFSGLELQPAWGLIARPIIEGSLESVLAVRGVTWGTLPYESPQVVDKLFRRRETADAEREENPAPGVGGLGRVVCELLADLAVNFVAELGPKYAVADYEV